MLKSSRASDLRKHFHSLFKKKTCRSMMTFSLLLNIKAGFETECDQEANVSVNRSVTTRQTTLTDEAQWCIINRPFNPLIYFYQTVHGWRLMGGGINRSMDWWCIDRMGVTNSNVNYKLSKIALIRKDLSRNWWFIPHPFILQSCGSETKHKKQSMATEPDVETT